MLRIDPSMLQGQGATGAQGAPGPRAQGVQSAGRRASLDAGPFGAGPPSPMVRPATRSEAKELARDESVELGAVVADFMDGAAEGVRNLLGAATPGARCGPF